MRTLILSDIHSNIEALNAVLDAAPKTTYDQLLVLGDLVGYGASPNEVVDRIYDLQPDVLIRGNHDKAASGLEPPHSFNRVAAEAATWTLSTLTITNRERLAALPSGPTSVDDTIEVCHGTPFDEDAYVFDENDARKALASASRRICFFGHTHVPIVFSPQDSDDRLEVVVPEQCSDEPTMIPLDARRRYLINPGSVGQPRDGDSRAAYAIYDNSAACVTLHRAAYRVDLAQERMSAARLPESLARRLGVGR